MTTALPLALRSCRRGFTLVEILIVVVILAILAAIVVPHFSSATEETRENTMAVNLWRIRQQIELYKQHHGEYPKLATFAEQMTMSTNVSGETAAPDTHGYIFGPYLSDVPDNAFTNNNIVGDGEAGTSDWYYHEATGAFHPNDSETHRAF
ncbi:MAG: prepilin-type N-terminal cleavage/methylation domain-containing protein [Phycisphaeraceae bacterium]